MGIFAAEETTPGSKPRIALIIDDMGYDRNLGMEALALSGAISFSFLPHTPHAWELATQAHTLGKEVMLHLPMESDDGNRLGKGGLTLDMPKEQFLQAIEKALSSVPYVSGVNNHMGSLLTRDPTAMRWLMSAIRERGLFFIDSRTTGKSLAEKVARKNHVRTARRHVFLDNLLERKEIYKQFKKLTDLAIQNGSAIGIGHPHAETIAVLSEQIPNLESLGVELVYVSQLTGEGSKLWHAYLSHSPRDAKNSKPLPSPIY